MSEDLLRNLSLDEEQCSAAFPGLTKEIDDSVAQGPFPLKQTGDSGPLQGRIKDGKLYIVHAQRRADLSREMLNASLRPNLLGPKPPQINKPLTRTAVPHSSPPPTPPRPDNLPDGPA